MAWKSTNDLLESIHLATERLQKDEISPEKAQAEARLLGVATRLISVQLKHARVTGRLKSGSDRLPNVKLAE
jgi:hypothetical protein